MKIEQIQRTLDTLVSSLSRLSHFIESDSGEFEFVCPDDLLQDIYSDLDVLLTTGTRLFGIVEHESNERKKYKDE